MCCIWHRVENWLIFPSYGRHLSFPTRDRSSALRWERDCEWRLLLLLLPSPPSFHERGVIRHTEESQPKTWRIASSPSRDVAMGYSQQPVWIWKRRNGDVLASVSTTLHFIFSCERVSAHQHHTSNFTTDSMYESAVRYSTCFGF